MNKFVASFVGLVMLAVGGSYAVSPEGFKPSDLIPASVEVNGGCSGSLISETEILTAAHCTEFGKRVINRVKVKDSEFNAYIKKIDVSKDLVVLVVPGVHFQGALKIAESQGELGDTMLMMGNPRAQAPDSLVKGIISYLDRKDVHKGQGGIWEYLTQYHAYAAPGSSGSAIVNEKGEIIGVLVTGYGADNYGGDIVFGVRWVDIKEFLAK